MGCRLVTRRNGNGKRHRDQDLALALLRLEAAFGPVEVLQVRPNPRPAGQDAGGNQARERTDQPSLDLDGHQPKGVRRSPGAIDARPGG
jgi:hypothetical protein